MVYSNEEFDRLKQQIISIANDEAKKIIYSAKTEAEAESSVILEESDKTLGNIKKNIDNS
jgi:F0F1-type ATP synthase membrane subunit b/b'